ncbi:hypothetical protein [Haloferula sp.]|uniref:hypothetical protein n=1 Tax=Haloferula sp. TaxID=2497595 RepID=UPI00329D7EA2
MKLGVNSTGIQRVLLTWLTTSAVSTAASLTIQGSEADSLNLHLSADPLSYFYLKQSTDLTNFTPFSMVLGDHATTWPLSTEDVPTRFFNVTQISLFSPEDTDGDGIDDVYEIRHPILNPLDGSDAGFLSGNGNLTFLQEYQSVRGVDTAPPEVFSREVSSFNFGEVFEAAASREISVFNVGSPMFAVDALSREVSVFNGGLTPQSLIAEVYSREVSTFNFGGSSASANTLSREISIFNGDATPSTELAEVHSREISLFNFGGFQNSADVISREVSAFNFGARFSSIDIISRELSVINNNQ